jgi:uncharacterized repeat protein (TIGR03803 family)
MNRSLLWVGAVVATMALAACGGGNGNDAGNSSGNGTSAGNGAGTGTGGSNTSSFSIGGMVTGLPSGGHLSLLDNGSNAQTVSANGSFTLTATVAAGSSYSISVGTQPTGYQCAVTQGSGTIAASNVTNVALACTQITATVGGSVSGLTVNGLVLANGTDTLSVPANATTFTMPKAVGSGTAYTITIRTSPTAMHCAVSNGSGVGSNSPVTGVNVSCGPASLSTLYTFGAPPDGQQPWSVIQGSDGNFYGTTPLGGANGTGTLFMVTPGGVEKVLWSFGSGSDGSKPAGGLVQGNDGNFYGVTSEGGTNQQGTVFRITPSGSETVLWSFGNGTDGSSPSGSLLQASDGNFYGMTESGGTASQGVIFRLTPSGTETVLVSFSSSNNLSGESGNGLIQGSDGNLYGLTGGGGSSGYGAIFKMTLDGTLTTLWSFDYSDGYMPSGSLVQASDGNFYGTTGSGGTGYGTVFKMTPAGVVSIIYTFGAAGDGDSPTGNLIQAADGNLYGTTLQGGANYTSVLFQITLTGTETTLLFFPATGWAAGGVIQGIDGGLYGAFDGYESGGDAVFQFN